LRGRGGRKIEQWVIEGGSLDRTSVTRGKPLELEHPTLLPLPATGRAGGTTRNGAIINENVILPGKAGGPGSLEMEGSSREMESGKKGKGKGNEAGDRRKEKKTLAKTNPEKVARHWDPLLKI